jgi:hypothetical protein
MNKNRPSSSKDEERSTIGTFSEGPPCSNTNEQWQCEEISNGDFSGEGDPDGASGGVKTLLDEDDPSFKGK